MGLDDRKPVDLWLLELCLEAAGGKCVHCGKPLTLATVSRGHINKRKKDGSNDGPENVVPVHLECNRKHTRTLVMPVKWLPPNYFERLRILILARIPGQIPCNLVDSPKHLVLVTQADENTYFIDLKGSQLDAATEVYIWSRKLVPIEAEKLVDSLIDVAAKLGVPEPLAPIRNQMISKALDNGEDAFQRVRERLLRLKLWLIGDRLDMFFWQRAFDNFERHDRLARREAAERAVEWAEKQKRDAEAAVKEAAKKEIEYKRSGLVDYLSHLNDDWLCNPDNCERRDALRNRIQWAEPDELEVLAKDVSAMSLEVSKWYGELPPHDPDWIEKGGY